ncbi:MAG: hypothetical protein ACKOCH_26165, partial [Bacteroidota bacterium]
PDVPKNAWIPALEVSHLNKGEAFVVMNDYRRNDWNPYLFHTSDYGRKWKRIASPKNLPTAGGAGGNFCLSMVQDTEVPSLLFLGTDQGLYVSVDYGDNWVKWPEESFPSVPVYDMKIQQRDGDLVLATFGRAVWVLDNLAPLREIAATKAAVLDQPLKLLRAQPGILAEYRSLDGARFAVDATYEGESKGTSVRIPVWVKPGLKSAVKEEKKDKEDKSREGKKRGGGDKKKEMAIVTITAMSGDTVRRFKTELDTMFNSAIWWGMDTKGVRFPSKNDPPADQLEPGGGPQALPGDYLVRVKYMDWSDSVRITVLDDPRLTIATADREARNQAVREIHQLAEKASKAYDRLKEAEKILGLVESQFVNVPDSVKKETLKLGNAIKDSINVLKDGFFNHKETKGIQRGRDGLNSFYWNALGYINGNVGKPNSTARIAMDKARRETE